MRRPKLILTPETDWLEVRPESAYVVMHGASLAPGFLSCTDSGLPGRFQNDVQLACWQELLQGAV